MIDLAPEAKGAASYEDHRAESMDAEAAGLDARIEQVQAIVAGHRKAVARHRRGVSVKDEALRTEHVRNLAAQEDARDKALLVLEALKKERAAAAAQAGHHRARAAGPQARREARQPLSGAWR